MRLFGLVTMRQLRVMLRDGLGWAQAGSTLQPTCIL